jgi:hypothetical protein
METVFEGIESESFKTENTDFKIKSESFKTESADFKIKSKSFKTESDDLKLRVMILNASEDFKSPRPIACEKMYYAIASD